MLNLMCQTGTASSRNQHLLEVLPADIWQLEQNTALSQFRRWIAPGFYENPKCAEDLQARTDKLSTVNELYL